jgi:hypothetical protein
MSETTLTRDAYEPAGPRALLVGGEEIAAGAGFVAAGEARRRVEIRPIKGAIEQGL